MRRAWGPSPRGGETLVARAYAQWVALKSGDRRMLVQADARPGDQQHTRIPLRVASRGFLPTPLALDTLFEHRDG